MRTPMTMTTIVCAVSRRIDQNRIDDPNGGRKGRGLWAAASARTPFHMETGKGQTPIARHIQLRPDPLAK
jgi:hypothetical protein